LAKVLLERGKSIQIWIQKMLTCRLRGGIILGLKNVAAAISRALCRREPTPSGGGFL
jgi:hypothetical protein